MVTTLSDMVPFIPLSQFLQYWQKMARYLSKVVNYCGIHKITMPHIKFSSKQRVRSKSKIVSLWFNQSSLKLVLLSRTVLASLQKCQFCLLHSQLER